MSKEKHIFIVGSKGIPANYGGYETFVDKLTEYKKNDALRYHVACAVDDASKVPPVFTYNDAECFNIEWKKVGAAKAIFYDIDALKYVISYIKKNNIDSPIVYILACRIGPFVNHFVKKIHALGGTVFVNPDGHEWMRAKWSAPVRKYWKVSESMMVHHADLLVCDSKNIEKYIHDEYEKFAPKTTFIAYGAETKKSELDDRDKTLIDWYSSKGLSPKEYYLVVGRFVPENNYETMIREFMASDSKKDFALITNVNEKFLSELEERTHFKSDERIKFVGTVYDSELLKKIRENAYGYFHGHEVGGTNPSLLEALGSTELNLLLDVGFNKEVAEDAALYWTKAKGNLAELINKSDKMDKSEIKNLGAKAKKRIADEYSWEHIVNKYEQIWRN